MIHLGRCHEKDSVLPCAFHAADVCTASEDRVHHKVALSPTCSLEPGLEQEVNKDPKSPGLATQ